MGWSAEQYAKFLDDRTRPARDLLSVVGVDAPRHVADLGCGPGNSTALLTARWPEAHVTGLDSDPDMIRAARATLPDCAFELADIETWAPQTPPDVIFANASLQWLGDHEGLFARLTGLLAPGGALAVQMPDNLDEPTHVAMRTLAADPRWSARLAAAAGRRKPLIAPAALHAMLRPVCARVDIWRTTYHFELNGLDAITEWFRGSGLRPYLEALNPAEQASYLAAFRETIAPAYPEVNGRVLLAFPRYFFVAQKAA